MIFLKEATKKEQKSHLTNKKDIPLDIKEKTSKILYKIFNKWLN